MKAAILLKKIGMTQNIDLQGNVSPITILKLVEQEVVSIKTQQAHGYNAILVGYGENKNNQYSKPNAGIYNKLGVMVRKNLIEFRLDQYKCDEYEEILKKSSRDDSASEESVDKKANVSPLLLTLDMFELNDTVCVRSRSKGKGFQGTIKRHNFARGPESHGSKNHRKPGSIGAGTDPARVFKGTKMGGRMGNKFVTIKNLVIKDVDLQNQLVHVSGAVPGSENQIVLLYK